MDQDRQVDWRVAVSELRYMVAARPDSLDSGDLLLQLGEAGAKQAVEKAGMKWGTARQRLWVSKTFPLGHPIRELGLGYSKLRALVKTPDPLKWAKLAAKDNWPVAELKEQLKHAAGKLAPDQSDPCTSRLSRMAPVKIKAWENLEPHPAAEIFRLMDEGELAELEGSIAENGFDSRFPIIVYEGRVLDGRNRLAACKKLRLDGKFSGSPAFVDWSGPGDPADWVVRANLVRRHLTVLERSDVGLKLISYKEREAARQRQMAGLAVSNPHIPVPASLQEPGEKGEVVEHAARAVGTSPRSLYKAKAVQQKAPELYQQALAEGKSLESVFRAVQEPKAPPVQRIPEGLKEREEASTNGHAMLAPLTDPHGQELKTELILRRVDTLEVTAPCLAAFYSFDEWTALDSRVREEYARNAADPFREADTHAVLAS